MDAHVSAGLRRGVVSAIVLRAMVLAGFIFASCTTAQSAFAQSFDQTHAAWTKLLKKNVVLIDAGRASRVDYAAFAADHAALEAYTAALSSVPQASFEHMAREQQMAFLINAYNAFTVKLILSRYPALDSIRDLGSFVSSPWKQKFIPLLGARVSLDAIEQEMLRARGRYDDPRIHFALNCASISCPMLRDEAYLADRLEAQLDDQAHRFMADRKRNGFDVATRQLRVSKIFDWYADDFRHGFRGIASTHAFFARYADTLADTTEGRELIKSKNVPVTYLGYDWRLNDVQR